MNHAGAAKVVRRGQRQYALFAGLNKGGSACGHVSENGAKSFGRISAPANDGTGGPFTIGRVIHSSRSVGFTGWIGGVAVFNRPLSAKELAKLAAMAKVALILPRTRVPR